MFEKCRFMSHQFVLLFNLQVYDYDWAFRDDFMGEASVALTQLQLDSKQELLITLAESGNTEYLGQLGLSLKLQAKDAADRSGSIVSHISSVSSNYARASSTDAANAKVKAKATPWSAVVNVVLIEGRDLLAMDLDGASDPYCKFR